MKRSMVIAGVSVVLIVIAIEIISHFSSENGYYNSVEQLRASEKLYNSSTIIHTQEMADRYVDFILDEDENYCVIEINKVSTWFGQKYTKGVWSSKPMGDEIRDEVFLYDQSEVLNFTWLPHFFEKPKVKLLHCIALGGSNIVDDSIKTVPFTYNGIGYLLCLKFEVNE